MKLKQVVLFVAGAGAALACAEDVDSEAIRTRGMYADYSALATGNGETSVSTSLRVGGKNGTFVELTGDDKLAVIVNGKTTALKHKGRGNKHYYEVDVDGDEAETEVQVAFTRNGLDLDATDSVVNLPAPFKAKLETPMPDGIERGNNVKLAWDANSSGLMSWAIEGDCIWSDKGEVNDDGSMTIPADRIRVQDEGEECEVTLTLERESKGHVDSVFEEGGRFFATQRRKVSFVSLPGDDEVDPNANGGAGGGSN